MSVALEALTPLAGYRQVPANEVREWAIENGYDVKPGRGRLPHAVIEDFNKKNKRRRRQFVIGAKVQGEVTYDYTTKAGRAGKFSAQPSAIREWAEDNGHQVGARGRFRQDVLDAYGQAHQRTRKPKAEAEAA